MSAEPPALPPTTADALREELARVRAELAKYVGHEPTVAEEMQYIRDTNRRLEQVITFLLVDALDRSQITFGVADMEWHRGDLEIGEDGESVTVTYHWPA